jgi:ASCH domain
MGIPMRALSFSQPWLWSILHAGKRVENRSWPPPVAQIGQRFALHAAKSWDDDAVGFMLKLGVDHAPARRDLYPAGAIVGVATIDRVVTVDRTLADDQKRWFFGEYGWILTDVVAFRDHLSATGKQGLWTLTEDQENWVLGGM